MIAVKTVNDDDDDPCEDMSILSELLQLQELKTAKETDEGQLDDIIKNLKVQLPIHEIETEEDEDTLNANCDATVVYSGKIQLNGQLHERPLNPMTSIENHVTMQNGEMEYKCKYCSKEFSQSRDVNLHTQMYCVEKPFKCQICTKTFTVNNRLINHIRTHTGERPYKCEFCAKSFTSSQYVIAHKRMHSQERAYKCQVCTKRFKCKSDLNSHSRTHAGNQSSQKHKFCAESSLRSSDTNRRKRTDAGVIPDLSFDEPVMKQSRKRRTRSHFDVTKSKSKSKSKKNLRRREMKGERGRETGELHSFEEGSNVGTFGKGRLYGCGFCNEIFCVEKDAVEHCSIHSQETSELLLQLTVQAIVNIATEEPVIKSENI